MKFFLNLFKRAEQKAKNKSEFKLEGVTNHFREYFLIETIRHCARCFGAVVVKGSYSEKFIYTGIDNELIITVQIDPIKMEAVKSYEELIYSLDRSEEFNDKQMLEKLEEYDNE
jgi:hypothetical protein